MRRPKKPKNLKKAAVEIKKEQLVTKSRKNSKGQVPERRERKKKRVGLKGGKTKYLKRKNKGLGENPSVYTEGN